MESEATNKSRVVMVESGESWDFYISQATTQTRPIAVHFTASWCMPSVAMNPIFEDLASAHPDIMFLTVDVDAVKIFVSAIFTKIRLQIFGDLILSHEAGNEHRVVSSGNFILIEAAAKMEVNAMPTFVLVKDSAQVDKIVGANPEEIRKRIDSFVQSIPANIAQSL
ncbi:hypothetical protein H0E87_020314 [Populus deltoides]|uniref:Thioredoxin domain-containing protein n=1 Tax=Populus deltoides TaxID=3696 RepID=A0A8T2XJ11_POPDE|nr:hypothetical protein H0E87_020314 [Populus deltoides]